MFEMLLSIVAFYSLMLMIIKLAVDYKLGKFKNFKLFDALSLLAKELYTLSLKKCLRMWKALFIWHLGEIDSRFPYLDLLMATNTVCRSLHMTATFVWTLNLSTIVCVLFDGIKTWAAYYEISKELRERNILFNEIDISHYIKAKRVSYLPYQQEIDNLKKRLLSDIDKLDTSSDLNLLKYIILKEEYKRLFQDNLYTSCLVAEEMFKMYSNLTEESKRLLKDGYPPFKIDYLKEYIALSNRMENLQSNNNGNLDLWDPYCFKTYANMSKATSMDEIKCELRRMNQMYMDKNLYEHPAVKYLYKENLLSKYHSKILKNLSK